MATDPVCGMFVDERTADLTLYRANRTYYFCSSACRQQFAEPERELTLLRRRLAVAWPLATAILVLSYGPHFSVWAWLAFGFATVVQFYAGLPFYRGTADAIRARSWNMDVLIAVGTTAAYGYSVASLVVPTIPSAFYFDAASLIIALILTGNYLEHFVRERARGSVRALGELMPSSARVMRGGVEIEVPVSEVRIDDLVRVRPGAPFPADGVVREGVSSVNESLVTGESLPVPKGPGDPVVAGTVNGEGQLTVRATHVGADTFLARVGQLLTEAESAHVPLQRLADRIASIFVPVVLILALGSAIAWFFFGGADESIAVLVFVSVVITACPCAFGLATPAALVAGTGRAAEEGILFRGRDSIEQASRVTIVLTDKTGTLTLGAPVLTDVIPRQPGTEQEVIALAAGIEAGSEHVLARAVQAVARSRAVAPADVAEIVADPGRGARGRFGGEEVGLLAGHVARAAGTDLGPLDPTARALEREGKSWSVLTRAGRVLGVLGFADEVRPEAAEAIRELREDGIDVAMLTGDHETAARRVAEPLGIRDVRARLTPESKLREIEARESSGGGVAYVGDGINDAPALARADLGIAIGTGTEVAREAGGVILVSSDLRGIPGALRIARRTVRKVRGNLAWALGYNIVLLPIAMGALVPVFGLAIFHVLPVTGAIAMAASSSLVVLNSYSLRFVHLR